MSVAIVETKPGMTMAEKLAARNVKRDGPKKRAAEHPTITGHESLADGTVAALHALVDAEASAGLMREQIEGLVWPEYKRLSLAGRHSKTIIVAGADTAGVQYTRQSRFSVISQVHEAVLKTDPGYAKHFTEKRQVSLANTSDAALAELEQVFADANETRRRDGRAVLDMWDWIKVEVVIGCASQMDEWQFIVPDAVRALLVQAKASISSRKEEQKET